jgi:hypothetical protein
MDFYIVIMSWITLMFWCSLPHRQVAVNIPPPETQASVCLLLCTLFCSWCTWPFEKSMLLSFFIYSLLLWKINVSIVHSYLFVVQTLLISYPKYQLLLIPEIWVVRILISTNQIPLFSREIYLFSFNRQVIGFGGLIQLMEGAKEDVKGYFYDWIYMIINTK